MLSPRNKNLGDRYCGLTSGGVWLLLRNQEILLEPPTLTPLNAPWSLIGDLSVICNFEMDLSINY